MNDQLLARESDIISLTAAGFTTGLKVSWKSYPSFCRKPWATSFALYLSTLPSDFSLILNTHFDPIAWQPFGKSTKDQVLFFYNAWYSSFIADCQVGLDKASETVLGRVWVRKTLGLKIPFLALVVIEWDSVWGFAETEATKFWQGCEFWREDGDCIGEDIGVGKRGGRKVFDGDKLGEEDDDESEEEANTEKALWQDIGEEAICETTRGIAEKLSLEEFGIETETLSVNVAHQR